MLKNRLVLVGLTLALGLINIPALAAEPQPTAIIAAEEKDRYTNAAEGFSMMPPKGWSEGEGAEQYFVMYFGPRKDNFTVNLNVNSTDDDGTTLTELSKQIKAHYPTQFNAWKVGEEGTTKIAGKDSYFISSKFSMEGYKIQNLQYFIPGTKASGKFYIVTFTCLEKDYATYSKIFKDTAKSIQVFDIEDEE